MSARGRTTARRLMQSIFASEWAIRPEWLEEFASIATRFGSGETATLTAEAIRSEIRRALAELNEGRDAQEALTADVGAKLREDSRATVRDGVAIIRVNGPLFHYASGFDDVCGCSSYEQLARDIAAVRESRGVANAVLFEFDTPGGEVAGCAEASDMIAALAAEMPNAAYVTDLCCSAGYWLASATSKIVVARPSLIGCLGVVATYRGKKKGDGPPLIEIVSSQSPKKRPDVETAEGRAQIQQTVDALAEVFVADVARHRGVSVDTVLADYGQGDVFVGANALTAGMADELGSFESVLAELAASASRAGKPAAIKRTSSMAPKNNETPAAENEPVEITAAYLAENHADIVEQFRAEGRAESTTAAATAERERILGIQALALPGNTELVTASIGDASVTPAMFAEKQTLAEKAKAAAALQALSEDTETPPAAPNAGIENGASRDQKVSNILNAGKRKPASK